MIAAASHLDSIAALGPIEEAAARLRAEKDAFAVRARCGGGPMTADEERELADKWRVLKRAEMVMSEERLADVDVLGRLAKAEPQRVFWTRWINANWPVLPACEVLGEAVDTVRVIARGLDRKEVENACRAFVLEQLKLHFEGVWPDGMGGPVLADGKGGRPGNLPVGKSEGCYKLVNEVLRQGYCMAVVERVVGRRIFDGYTYFRTAILGQSRHRFTVEQIFRVVCEVVGVCESEVCGDGRHELVVVARAMTAHVAKRLTNASYPDIAEVVRPREGRTGGLANRTAHSTVIDANSRLTERLQAGGTMKRRGKIVRLEDVRAEVEGMLMLGRGEETKLPHGHMATGPHEEGKR